MAVTRSSAVETSQMSTPARSVAARSSASRCSPAVRSRCRNSSSLESTTSCSPVSASWTTISPASGSSYSRGSSSRIATTSWRSLRRCRGCSHPGVVMKSETRTTSDRRRIVRFAVSSSRLRSVTAPLVSGGDRSRLRVRASTWLRLLRGGSVSSSSLSNRIAPTWLPPRVRSRANVVASSHRTSSFGRSIGPKPIEGDRSSSSHAVSSRSSAYWRTNGVSIRAVTFQSMCRTSSPASYSRRSRKSIPSPRNTVR